MGNASSLQGQPRGEKGSVQEHISVIVWKRFSQGWRVELWKDLGPNWACQQCLVHPSLQSLWRNFFTLDFQRKQNEVLNSLTFWNIWDNNGKIFGDGSQ